MTPEERSDVAKKAAALRHSTLKVTHGSDDNPLRIGSIELPCYVLENGTRILSQTGLISGLGMSRGGPKDAGDRLAIFLGGKAISPFISSELALSSANPIRFKNPSGGGTAYGYPATVLADICDAILEARNAGVLQKQQEHIAQQAEILVRGFARVGIIALVDEATGYQADRARDALARILEDFVARELRPWVKTFPVEYYRQIYRLNGWEFDEEGGAYYGVVGHWTNNIIYKRLAPGVWEELNRITPRYDCGKLKHRLFQRLTEGIGHPKLREHMASIIMLMKYSPDWRVFMSRLDKELPQFGSSHLLPFPDGYEPKVEAFTPQATHCDPQ